MWRSLVIFLLAAAVLIGLLLFSQRESEGLKVSGFLEADEIRVGSRVGGRVAEVHMEEGRRVEAGDLLLRLEPFDLLERKAEAEAQLARSQAEYDRLQAGFREEEQQEAQARVAQAEAALDKSINGPRPEEIRVAERNLEEAEARLELARLEHERVESLSAKGAATPEQLDLAASQVKTARATAGARQEQLALLRKGTREEEIDEARARLAETRAVAQLRQNGFRTEDIAKARASRDTAQATLRAIKEQIEELTVRAPQAAIVDAVNLEPGDLLQSNAPALSLVLTEPLWVRAYVPEDSLGIATGQQVSVSVDSFPGERFAGHVSFVSRQAEFTPRNVQTPEERSKQVFRIKVMLDEGLDKLRPGMAADVWFEKE